MSGGDEKTRAALARVSALGIPDAAVSSPELSALHSLVELGKLDVSDSDALLVTVRDKLQAALARDDLPARDTVAISAELRSVHEKLLAVVVRRERELHGARCKAKIAAVTHT